MSDEIVHIGGDLVDKVAAKIQVQTTPNGFPIIPESFWEAQPELIKLRQWARYQRVPAPALLGAVLARIAAAVDHSMKLPAVVGSAKPLSFYAGCVGYPGAGKSSAAGLAR